MSSRMSRSRAAALRSPSPPLPQASDHEHRSTPITRASQDVEVDQDAASDELEEADDVNSTPAADSDDQLGPATSLQARGSGRRRRGARSRGPSRRKEFVDQDNQDNGSDTPRKRGGWRGRGFGAGRWAKAKGGPSHATQAPIDREGNIANVINDEAELPEDAEGEKKVSKLGELYGGREYRVRTFKIDGKGDRLYMLSTEPARCIGFRDSYLFFQKHKQLYKIIIAEDAKKDLIDRDIIPHSYKGRLIGVVTARSVFREFGAKIIVGGKRILDDYLVSEARERGDIEGEYAVPEDELPGGAGHYDRNRYVAWHGASSVYHSANPSVPLLNGKPTDGKKKRIVVNGANWMSEHALQASRFNSQTWIQRSQTLEGVYNVHTNSMQYPRDMQPTRVRWERSETEAPKSDNDPSKTCDEDLMDWATSTEKPARYTHRFMVVDTFYENPSASDLDCPAPNIMNIDDDIMEELPRSCRQQLLKARSQRRTWTNRWPPRRSRAMSIKVSYNS